jgi:guanylate cyclase soluble subunit beta
MNALHDRITGTFLNYIPPEFRVETLDNGRHHIHYISQRQGLTGFVVGLLKGLSQRFETSLEFHSVEPQPVDAGSHIIFDVTVGNDAQ